MKLKDPFETTLELKTKIGSSMEKIARIIHKWEVVEVSDDSD